MNKRWDVESKNPRKRWVVNCAPLKHQRIKYDSQMYEVHIKGRKYEYEFCRDHEDDYSEESFP